MGVCSCSMFCCTLLYVHSSFAIILMGKRELVALLTLSSWCIVIVVWLFPAVPWVCLHFVIVVFPDHTHLLFFLILHDCKINLRYRKHSHFKTRVINFEGQHFSCKLNQLKSLPIPGRVFFSKNIFSLFFVICFFIIFIMI